ncbi:hypothetical protein HanHA89_Chr05g0201231 [Helianthus annuus]|nr:hypothetical protein HanHA89_Chr05g0201231 [Helianthus annuus]
MSPRVRIRHGEVTAELTWSGSGSRSEITPAVGRTVHYPPPPYRATGNAPHSYATTQKIFGINNKIRKTKILTSEGTKIFWLKLVKQQLARTSTFEEKNHTTLI